VEATTLFQWDFAGGVRRAKTPVEHEKRRRRAPFVAVATMPLGLIKRRLLVS